MSQLDFTAEIHGSVPMKAPPNSYYDETWVETAIRQGKHREIIGGLWDEIGSLQFEFLVGKGLLTDSWFVDVGCGSLRAGVKLVPYLSPGRYYGIDVSNALLDAGYAMEIVSIGLGERLPRCNLQCNDRFDLSAFGRAFDFGIAQSVFTHLPINELARCLERIAPFFNIGGSFFATYFECPEDWPQHKPFRHPTAGIATHLSRDPFHYKRSWIMEKTMNLGWELELIGDWGHPRDQKMLRFTKTATN